MGCLFNRWCQVMINSDDPKFSELQEVREVLTMWAEYELERRSTGISMLGRMMESVRRPEKEYENKKSSQELVFGRPIRLPRASKIVIAERVRQIFQTPDLWVGHYHEKEVLASFFLHSSSNHIGCYQKMKAFCKRFHCTRWMAKGMIRASMLYFLKLWESY